MNQTDLVFLLEHTWAVRSGSKRHAEIGHNACKCNAEQFPAADCRDRTTWWAFHLGEKRAIRTSALSSGQKRALQPDAHTVNGYKWSRRTLPLADGEADKSLTKGFVGNARERQK